MDRPASALKRSSRRTLASKKEERPIARHTGDSASTSGRTAGSPSVHAISGAARRLNTIAAAPSPALTQKAVL